MTFLNVADSEKLCGVLDACVGSVDLIAPDGKAYDWKTHSGALRALLTQCKHIDRLTVRADNPQDQYRMLRLMMQQRAS